MHRSRKPWRGQRRDFLKGMAVLGGGAAIAVSTGARAEPPELPGTADAPPGKGYQETAHVREYYDKARF